MQERFCSHNLPDWDNLTDNGYSGSVSDYTTGNITPVTGGLLSTVYNSSYLSIARINNYLQKLKNFTGISAEKKERNEAEARMLRAFFYSYLYRCYGEVPVIDEPLDLSNQFQPKKPASEVLDFMMSDLDFAIAKLKDETYAQSKGRWTVNAAKAYKARMLLYDAYDRDGKAIISQMEAVKTLLSGISGYSLAEDFSDNFQDPKQEACPEILFSVKFLAPNNYNNSDQWYGSWIYTSPMANFISEFDMIDGSPGQPVPYSGNGVIDHTVVTNDVLLNTREPRAAKTVFMNVYRIGGIDYTPDVGRPLGTGLYKFLSQNITPPYGYSSYSQQDWVILRYADVLLMLAEAENEINGPTNMAYNAINAIRERGKTSELPEGLTKDQMRERIRHERRIELAFEGGRYFDLKRWKIAKQVLNNTHDGVVTYHFEDKHNFWPLPQAEIDKSNGILVQNPDYK
jgi:hypothetical protein